MIVITQQKNPKAKAERKEFGTGREAEKHLCQTDDMIVLVDIDATDFGQCETSSLVNFCLNEQIDFKVSF